MVTNAWIYISYHHLTGLSPGIMSVWRKTPKSRKVGTLNILGRWINVSHPFLFETKSLAKYHATTWV